MALDGLPELVSSIAAVGENMAQPGKAETHGFQHIDRPVAVLDIGGMDQNEYQVAAGVGEDVALATLDLLAGIKATNSASFRWF